MVLVSASAYRVAKNDFGPSDETGLVCVKVLEQGASLLLPFLGWKACLGWSTYRRSVLRAELLLATNSSESYPDVIVTSCPPIIAYSRLVDTLLARLYTVDVSYECYGAVFPTSKSI